MNDSKNSIPDNEIDLKNLFLSLWAYKILIVCIFIMSIFLGGFYILSQDIKYTSTATFKMDKDQGSSLSLSGDVGMLANIAGFDSGPTEDLSMDKISGRVFIESLDTQIDFLNDPYFNTFNPSTDDAMWKVVIKKLIGWKKDIPSDLNEAVWQNIINEYSKNISVEETKSGSVKIRVTHTNANRASEIANLIMYEILASQKNKKNKDQDQQLEYLSETLADALGDLEIAQSNLKTFALENSALPLESFAAGSLELEDLRDQYNRTSILFNAVSELAVILKKKNITQVNYFSLREKYPIIDQVEFRRIMGQSEIISSWSWPDIVSVEAVKNTLIDRKSILQAKIESSQKIAERSSKALETFAKLERNAKIAEATYTVLIEQVKAESMVAGFRPDNSAIYEYAAPSSAPSEPKRRLLLMLSGFLGLSIGCVLALILSKRKNVYYSKDKLILDIQPLFNAKSKSLNIFRKRQLFDISNILVKTSKPILRDLTVEVNKHYSKKIIVTSSNSKLKSNNMALSLACYMSSADLKIAVINFSCKIKSQLKPETATKIGSYLLIEEKENVSVLMPGNQHKILDFLSQRNFVKSLQELNNNFELIIVCADDEDALTLLRSVEGQDIFHISLARLKHTKIHVLNQMASILSIQGLLHD